MHSKRVFVDDFSCRILSDIIKHEKVGAYIAIRPAKLIWHNWQHYFQALFYGVQCISPSVVPVPLAPAETDHLWDVSIWLTDESNTDVICTKDFVLLQYGRRMHCIIYHLCQQTAADGHARNRIISSSFRNWYGNVLVSWANNDWPPNLTPKEDEFLNVLYSP
jgi:hypothetical protein